MKQKIIIFLMLIICVGMVNAVPIHTQRMDAEIEAQSLRLNKTNVPDTVDTVMSYLWNKIRYKVYWFPRGTTTTWYLREGDCTDVSMLGQKMLNNLNISARIKHGFVKGPQGWMDGGHDWLEYYHNDSWHNYEEEKGYWIRMFEIGEGVW